MVRHPVIEAIAIGKLYAEELLYEASSQLQLLHECVLFLAGYPYLSWF